MKNLIAITAILALASSTAVNAKKDRHTNRLHKKNQRKLERNLRRGQVEQIDNLKKKRINQRNIVNDNNKNDIDGLEEDVTFWTNMVRKTQVTSLPGGPVDPDFGVDPVCQGIVDIAVGNPDFSTLVAALTAADLVGALSGNGPFTVFAPTNDAFAALPEGTVESLLEADNIEALTDILLYHVVANSILSTELVNGDVETLNGDSVTVNLDDGVMINDSNVITADIEACNGVIHVIDAVLLPPADDEEVDPPIPSPTPPLPPPTTDGGDVVASICAAGETCIEVGEICSDGTTEECCGETFDSFECECGSNLLYGSCGATNACLDIVCEGDGTGVDEDGTGGDVPPPAEGFICPDASFVGCTAVDPTNPVDECPTVGEPCPDGNNGEFCCNDGCPRRYCTAKQAPPSLTKKSMVDFVAEIDHAEVAAALAGGN